MKKVEVYNMEKDIITTEATPVEKNYLEEIERMKREMENMVPKEDYSKVIDEHKKLTEDYINKRDPVKKPEAKLESASFYAEKLIKNKFRNNKEFIETSLNYRDSFIKETGKDPWGDNGVTSEDTVEVYNHLKSLSEDIESPTEFNFRLGDSLADDPALTKAISMKRRQK